MVIHYLQYGTSLTVLPCLDGLCIEKFNSDEDILSIPTMESLPEYTSKTHDNLGMLLYSFLNHYNTKFKYMSDAIISVIMGGLLPVEDCQTLKIKLLD